MAVVLGTFSSRPTWCTCSWCSWFSFSSGTTLWHSPLFTESSSDFPSEWISLTGSQAWDSFHIEMWYSKCPYFTVKRTWSTRWASCTSISASKSALHGTSRNQIVFFRAPILWLFPCAFCTCCSRCWWHPVLDSKYLPHRGGYSAYSTFWSSNPCRYLATAHCMSEAWSHSFDLHHCPCTLWRRSCAFWTVLEDHFRGNPECLPTLEADLSGWCQR